MTDAQPTTTRDAEPGFALAETLCEVLYYCEAQDVIPALTTHFTWVAHVPAEEHQALEDDLRAVLARALGSGQYTQVADELTAWEGTARSYADGFVGFEDRTWMREALLATVA